MDLDCDQITINIILKNFYLETFWIHPHFCQHYGLFQVWIIF